MARNASIFKLSMSGQTSNWQAVLVRILSKEHISLWILMWTEVVTPLGYFDICFVSRTMTIHAESPIASDIPNHVSIHQGISLHGTELMWVRCIMRVVTHGAS